MPTFHGVDFTIQIKKDEESLRISNLNASYNYDDEKPISVWYRRDVSKIDWIEGDAYLGEVEVAAWAVKRQPHLHLALELDDARKTAWAFYNRKQIQGFMAAIGVKRPNPDSIRLTEQLSMPFVVYEGTLDMAITNEPIPIALGYKPDLAYVYKKAIRK